MDFFPVELVSYICSLACTDDGSTVRSLSSVSKFFHEICAPLRYQSLTLSKSEEVSCLATKLRSTPIHLRRILHLYISLTHFANTEDFTRVFEILADAAATVESLTFIYPDTIMSSTVIGRLFRIPFPALRELTIHGFYPYPSSPWIKMPRLERLHLSGNRNPYGLLHVGYLHECLPSLTHLKVSGLLMACSFIEELRLALELYRIDSESTVEESTREHEFLSMKIRAARLPQRLRHIIVEPGSFQSCRGTASGLKKHLTMMEQLQEAVHLQDDFFLRKQTSKAEKTLRLLLKKRPEAHHDCIEGVLYKNWLDRLEGKDGCWED